MTDYTILDLAKMVISPETDPVISVWEYMFDKEMVTVEVAVVDGSNSLDYSPQYNFGRKDWNIAIQNALISIGKEK